MFPGVWAFDCGSIAHYGLWRRAVIVTKIFVVAERCSQRHGEAILPIFIDLTRQLFQTYTLVAFRNTVVQGWPA
jgi:hypothetical protein